MRKFYWYLSAYIRKHGLIFFASLLIAILGFSFIIPGVARSLEKANHRHIGIVGEYTLATLPKNIRHKISGGLTRIEEGGLPIGLIAERWTVEQDGTTYRFLLRDNIYWQDGKPLKPEDINYRLRDVETIITPNDIVFKLPDAYAPFPTVVSEPLFREGSIAHWFFFEKPILIGTGEYQIVDYKTSGQRLTELTLDGPDERITYRFYLTEKDVVTAFKHGKVDILPELSQWYDIMDWDTTITTTTTHTDRYLAVFLNLQDPRFERNIRQALAYALEKPDSDIRVHSPINKQSWAYLQSAKVYEYDVSRAVDRALDNIPPEKLDITLTTTSQFITHAERIKQQWETFGQRATAACKTSDAGHSAEECDRLAMRVRVRISNFPDTSDFTTLLIGQEIPPDPDQYALWHSEQSTNFTGYKNTRIDTLLERGRQTFNQQERTEIYQEFQQFFLEDAPVMFLQNIETFEVRRK